MSSQTRRFLGPSAILCVLVSLFGCDIGSRGEVLSVTVLGGDRLVELASTVQLAVDVETTRGASDAVSWQSSDADTVIVNSSGLVVGVGMGSATVRAVSAFDPDKSGSIEVTVLEAPAPASAWTRHFAEVGYQIAYDVSLTPTDHVLVAGYFVGDLDGSASAKMDAYLIRLDPNGTTDWIRPFGTDDDDAAYAVATDSVGNVFVGGDTTGALQGTNAGGNDAFVRKYDSTGDIVWTRQFGTTNSDAVNAVATTADGAVVVAGYTHGELQGTNAGVRDAFVRKYDADGAIEWTRQFGSTETDDGLAVAVGQDGRVAVAGHTEGVLTGGSAGAQDAFVRVYGSDGSLVWTRQFGTAGDDTATGVAIDASGDVIVVGSTTGSLSGAAAGSEDVFVRKYSSSGGVLWTRQLGSEAIDRALGVAVDAVGNIFVAGDTNGPFAGPIIGGTDYILFKLTATGTVVWNLQSAGQGQDGALAVDVSADGRSVIAGLTLGGFEGQVTESFDLFVRKFPK